MSKKKKKADQASGFVPMFPGMRPRVPHVPPMIPMPPVPPMPGVPRADGDQEQPTVKVPEVASDVKANWEKTIDMQKSSIDKAKQQYSEFFDYTMDMMDSFADYFPEESLWMPWMPLYFESPKAFRKSMREFEEMANEYIVEQLDALSDFYIKSQKKACEATYEAQKNAEEKRAEAEAEEKAEEAEEAKPRTRSASQARQARSAGQARQAKAAGQSAPATPAKGAK